MLAFFVLFYKSLGVHIGDMLIQPVVDALGIFATLLTVMIGIMTFAVYLGRYSVRILD